MYTQLVLQELCQGTDRCPPEKHSFLAQEHPRPSPPLPCRLSSLNSSEPLLNPRKLGLQAPFNNEETVTLTQ